MKLYFGGAFQGKRELAKKENGISESEIAEGGSVREIASVRMIDHFEEQVREDLRRGVDPCETLRTVLSENPEIVLIMNEVGQGVLPREKADRDFAEAAGTVMREAAALAESVTRVFCGIGKRLK